jgi:thiol:disulfide interchange protein DsbD
MVVFKEVMGFLMLGAVVWFLNTLLVQVRSEQFIGALSFLLAVGAACWAYGKWASPIASAFSRNFTIVALVVVLAPAAYWLLDFSADENGSAGSASVGRTERDLIENNEEIIWRTFSWEFVQAESDAGRPVFVDATAAWCATCKVNERLVIRTPEIASLFKSLNYTVVKADFTRRNPDVWRWLTAHGKAGVPLYVIIPPNRFAERDVLPELLPGKDFLAERLKRGARRVEE